MDKRARRTTENHLQEWMEKSGLNDTQVSEALGYKSGVMAYDVRHEKRWMPSPSFYDRFARAYGKDEAIKVFGKLVYRIG